MGLVRDGVVMNGIWDEFIRFIGSGIGCLLPIVITNMIFSKGEV